MHRIALFLLFLYFQIAFISTNTEGSGSDEDAKPTTGSSQVKTVHKKVTRRDRRVINTGEDEATLGLNGTSSTVGSVKTKTKKRRKVRSKIASTKTIPATSSRGPILAMNLTRAELQDYHEQCGNREYCTKWKSKGFGNEKNCQNWCNELRMWVGRNFYGIEFARSKDGRVIG